MLRILEKYKNEQGKLVIYVSAHYGNVSTEIEKFLENCWNSGNNVLTLQKFDKRNDPFLTRLDFDQTKMQSTLFKSKI